MYPPSPRELGGGVSPRSSLVVVHEAGKDIGEYGRLVFAMVARHFLSENELVKLLTKDKSFGEDDPHWLELE